MSDMLQLVVGLQKMFIKRTNDKLKHIGHQNHDANR